MMEMLSIPMSGCNLLIDLLFPSASDFQFTDATDLVAYAQFNIQHSTLNTQIVDFRDAIRPKKPLPDPEFESKRYYQVYEQKYGFQPNMSILDLLFNEGNEAIFFL